MLAHLAHPTCYSKLHFEFDLTEANYDESVHSFRVWRPWVIEGRLLHSASKSVELKLATSA
jgi:hypothetical protein